MWKALSHAKLVFLSLFYNHHMSWSYAFDTVLEPLFYLVDNFAKVLGPIFVAGAVLMTSAVVAISYRHGLPYYLERKPTALTASLVVLGNYILVNVIFHYVLAYSRGPGFPPNEDNGALPQVVSVCKKCINPKPPRTHHCSVCNRCVLKMDHHCPWLNNCVGDRNHRHFFLYMVFNVAGCLYIMVFGFEIMWKELMEKEEEDTKFSLLSRRSLILFQALVTTGCFVVLGGLTVWHAKLISKGETSIEAHINRSETRRLRLQGKTYKNPYDFSPWHNWCLFLGMIDGRGWTSVLFPSLHRAHGDGLAWDTVQRCGVPWNDDRYGLKTSFSSEGKIA